MNKILISPEFQKDFEILIRWRKSLNSKIQKLYLYLEEKWFDKNISSSFNIADLWDWYFRFKFIPIRVIIKKEKDEIIFKKIFKRKWKSNYKFF